MSLHSTELAARQVDREQLRHARELRRRRHAEAPGRLIIALMLLGGIGLMNLLPLALGQPPLEPVVRWAILVALVTAASIGLFLNDRLDAIVRLLHNPAVDNSR